MAEYNLDALGWFQFERLCQSLLKARCGLSVEAWGHSGDMGRDAYAEETLTFPAQELNDGPFIFQVKFVNNANAAGADPFPALAKGVRAELGRIGKREESGQWEVPRYYALLTNTPLSGTQRLEVKEILQGGLPESQILIEAGSDIDALLDDLPRVRLAFPQVLGLRDIYSLLDERVNKDILKRSSLALDIGKERAASFVATEAYGTALNVLGNQHFVVLTGPPEMGKTTIAWMVALARLSGEWEAFECRTPEDFFRVHDTEQAQVFVVDDAFGSTEYQPDRATLWAEELEKVIRALDYRHWLLLTSRPAPLKTALERLNVKGAEEDFPLPHQVLVDASKLSVQEKAQILYRHAKSAVDDPRGRELIRDVAREVVNHEHFTPLRIRRFVANQVPAILAEPEEDQQELMARAVAANLETATREMTTSFRQLPDDCKALLIAMLDINGATIELDDLAVAFERHLGRAPERTILATALLIDDHFIRMTKWSSDEEAAETIYVEWVHPSVRDLVIDHLMGDAAARRDFLGKAGIDGVMLALSSEGGAEGNRLFPLLENEEDWREMKARVGGLPGSLSPEENSRLAALLADTARLAVSEEALEHTATLAELTRTGLQALCMHWSAGNLVLGNGELRNFYLASAGLLPPVPGPDISKSWVSRHENLTKVIYEEAGPYVDAAERWLELAALLRHYEPRWLMGLSFPASYKTVLEEIVERIESEQAALDSPWIDEEDDPSEYSEPPPNLDWIETAERLSRRIGRLDPELLERVEPLPAKMEEKSLEWEEYGERHEAYAEHDLGEGNDYDGRYREDVEVFDIGEFFSDL